MSSGIERIFHTIENTTNDKEIRDFLKEIIICEVEQPNIWRWKDKYRSILKKYTEPEDGQ